MASWIKRVAAVVVIAGGLSGFALSSADARPSRVCARVGVYVDPIEAITTCLPVP
jgi:hypothetical protein